MSLPPTPLHQTLPGTFAKREDAVAAIRGLAMSTGHKVTKETLQDTRNFAVTTV
jgi:hypothetical protein